MVKNFLQQCTICNGTRIILTVGSIEEPCTACKTTVNLLNGVQKIENWVMNNPFKETPVGLSMVLFLIVGIISYFYPNYFPGMVMTVFGYIFVALKYKLDQANYKKDLFEKRYEIFLILDTALAEWMREGKSSMKIRDEVTSVMRRSYYLFNKETYEFICKFRMAMICTENDTNKLVDENYRKKVEEEKRFLFSLFDNENLPSKFPELKINTY